MPLYNDSKFFKNNTVYARMSRLRLLLNSTKSSLDELLRPPVQRKCTIIKNLMASLMDDLDNHSEEKQRMSELLASFSATEQEIKNAMDLKY